MRTELIDPCRTFNTIACYKWDSKTKFLGSKSCYKKSEIVNSDLVLYRAEDSKELTNIDFAEYGVKFNPEKFKYNNKLLLEYIENTIKKSVGVELSELKKLENYPLYTLASKKFEGEDVALEYGYFSTVNINGVGDLYLIDVPEDIYKLELYGSSITKNNSDYNNKKFLDYKMGDLFNKSTSEGGEKVAFTNTPKLIITLGPDAEEYFNPSNSGLSYYYQGNYYTDGKLPKKTLDECLKKHSLETKEDYAKYYRVLEDEIYCRKLIWFLALDKKPSSINVNVSVYSFLKNENPIRNRNEYVIRNDEYRSSNTYPEPLYQKGSDIYHKLLDDTLGNIIENPYILDTKINLRSDKYSKYITYKKNSVVTFHGDKYISLVDNNRNNLPDISPSWMLYDNFKGYFTKNIYFVPNRLNALTIIPPYTTIPNNQETPISISIIENLGYSMDMKNYPKECIVTTANSKNESKELNVTKDLNYSETIVDGAKRKIFTITNWQKIHDIEGNKVIFGVHQDEVELDIKLLYNGKEYSIEDFPEEVVDFKKKFSRESITNYIYFTDTNNKLIDKGVIDTIGYNYKINLQDLFSCSANLKVISAKSVHYTPLGVVTKTHDLENNFNLIEDTLDATKVIYYIEIEKTKFKVKVEFDTRVYEVNHPSIMIGYGEDFILEYRRIIDPELVPPGETFDLNHLSPEQNIKVYGKYTRGEFLEKSDNAIEFKYHYIVNGGKFKDDNNGKITFGNISKFENTSKYDILNLPENSSDSDRQLSIGHSGSGSPLEYITEGVNTGKGKIVRHKLQLKNITGEVTVIINSKYKK